MSLSNYSDFQRHHITVKIVVIIIKIKIISLDFGLSILEADKVYPCEVFQLQTSQSMTVTHVRWSTANVFCGSPVSLFSYIHHTVDFANPNVAVISTIELFCSLSNIYLCWFQVHTHSSKSKCCIWNQLRSF